MKKWKKSLSQSALSLFFYRDINECRQNVCRPDQHCKNTRGGYKCIDLCPNGMTKAENGTCIGECLAISVTESIILEWSRKPILRKHFSWDQTDRKDPALQGFAKRTFTVEHNARVSHLSCQVCKSINILMLWVKESFPILKLGTAYSLRTIGPQMNKTPLGVYFLVRLYIWIVPYRILLHVLS